MSTSLRAISPQLAEILGEKQTTLRERQRALVQAGLLKSLPGRGRGAGVLATAESAAILLTSLLASVALVDAADLTHEMVQALPANSKKACSLTGAVNFLGALTEILSDPQTANRITRISASNYGTASIEYDNESRCGFVVLIADVPKMTVLAQNRTYSRFRVDISVLGQTLQEIATLLAKEVAK
ncbi:hypothetical protein [Nitrobacter winogradskyi]|uniref:hypothetical protein n=1 Tax=Nitrobacter winogradskyi TaxID=913 RepID=UPI00059C94E2|nr:hypothetical protein [Nitrobacter winogradskyi]